MRRGQRSLWLLLGCALIGGIVAWIERRDHGPDFRSRSSAIMGFALAARGAEWNSEVSVYGLLDDCG